VSMTLLAPPPSALEWGAEGWQGRVASLRERPVDYIVAADCVYIDRDGATKQSPSHVREFVQACLLLASEYTVCFIAFECRAHALRKEFLDHASSAFTQVRLLPQDVVSKGFQADHVELYCLQHSKGVPDTNSCY